MLILVGILLMLCIVVYLFFIPEIRMGNVRYRRSARSSVVLGGCALLVLLSGCGGSAASNPSITPVSMSPGAGSPTAPEIAGSDWTTYHDNNSHTGYLPNEPDPHTLTNAWKTQLDGAVYAEPLVVHNHVIVATEGDSLYSLDAATGKIVWRTNVGTPVDQPKTLPCGDINPLGITGTPVYDPATGLVFATAEVVGPAHILVGVDVNTGEIRVRRSADISAMNPTVHQERAALALSNGMVYVAYGGLAGDCGNYHGTVVASRTDGTGPLLSYQVPTPREGGIWGPSGPAIDSSGNVYVSVGNGSVTNGSWDHTDSVLRLSSTLHLEDGFAPTQWQQDNSTDADLGSMGPTLLPNGLVFIEGKSGLAYLLHANKLGGVGGQIQLLKNVCNGTAMGGTASIGTQVFIPCSDGLRQLLIGPGAHMTIGWHATSNINMPPIIGGHTVYSLDPTGTLYALNSDTGAIRAQVKLNTGELPRFVSPTLSGNRLFIGTRSGVVAVALA